MSSTKPVLMAVTALGLATGLIVDVMLARLVGATRTADLIVMALTIPFFFDVVLREGAKYSFVSIQFELGERLPARKVVGELLFIGGILGLVAFLSSVAAFFALVGSSEDQHGLLLSSLVGAMASVFALSATLASVADANGLFFLTSVRNLAVHGTALAFFLGAISYGLTPLMAMVVSYLVGGGGYLLAITYALVRKGAIGRPELPSSELRVQLKSKFLPALVNISSGQGARVIERMALLSAGEGALFVYYIGFRIYSSLQSVIGGTIATVATRGYRGVCWNTTILFALIKKSVVQVAAYTVPVAVCIWVFGAHFLDFVYGEKLGRQNVALATVVLDVLSLGLFFQTLHVVVASIWLFAGHAWVLTFMNVAYATSFSILVWWAAPIWGALGISVMVASGAVLLAIGNIALLSKSIRSRSM